jgi:uncharacterized protein YdiU (UPF0061 family)
MKNKLHFHQLFFKQFDENFYQIIDPYKFSNPQLIYLNKNLIDDLQLDFLQFNQPDIAKILAGSLIHESSRPIAIAYAGHQFGNFVSQLGDGRAILLGEIMDKKNHYYDLQLKGSGPTKFSRRGDGFATLASAIRELIIGESLHYLNVPTTRILSLSLTNSPVFREVINHGAVASRLLSSQLRVGSFEYLASRHDKIALKKLTDFAIDRHYPSIKNSENKVLEFFEKVVKNQAILIAKWQSLGFIHGVMNTDNMSIAGQSLDFGPCAFLDEYDDKKVFSAIDKYGRYSFGNQPKIAKWNLWILLNSLSIIFDDHKQGLMILDEFLSQYENNYYKLMSQKLGFKDKIIKELVDEFLEILKKNYADYTKSFRDLSTNLLNPNSPIIKAEDYKKWFENWRQKIGENYGFAYKNLEKIAEEMNKINPLIIARNHLIEEVIVASNSLDFKPLEKLLKALESPFGENLDENSLRYFSNPPTAKQKVRQTFCNT